MLLNVLYSKVSYFTGGDCCFRAVIALKYPCVAVVPAGNTAVAVTIALKEFRSSDVKTEFMERFCI